MKFIGSLSTILEKRLPIEQTCPIWAFGRNVRACGNEPDRSGRKFSHSARETMTIPEPVVVFILAVLQGIAEFLPISSSGHLVVVGHLLGSEGGPGLNVVLHFGTLLAIIVFFWSQIVAIIRSDRRVVPLLVAGTIPAGCVGLWLKKGTIGGKNYGWVLDDPLLAGFMLVITGYILLLMNRLKGGQLQYQKMGYGRAILIGCAQAIALLPGISRSGSTIVAGSALGLEQKSAATWSFLLAIPAIGAAMSLECLDLLRGKSTIQTQPQWLVMGIVVSAVVGWFSLKLLVRMLDKGRLHWFAYWLIPFGLGVVVWRLKVMVDELIVR